MRDWSRTQALGYYSIHPSQFNTRMPLHINDDDLPLTGVKVGILGHVTERPRSEFTMLSYTVHALEVAVFARESIDLRGPLCQSRQQEQVSEGAKMRNHLNKKYENFIAGLPSYFRLGSTLGLTAIGPMAAIPVQRWMLHQQLWTLFLRLHRASLSSQDSRATCQLLAQSIISTQAQIQARCAVCGSLSTSETQLFSAAIVLVIDLLSFSKHKDADRSSINLNRMMARDKLREAIELLRTRSDAEGSASQQDSQAERVKASAQRSVIALEALTRLEEAESGKDEESDGENSTENRLGGQGINHDRSTNISLKDKVMDVLEALQGDRKYGATVMEQTSLSSFSSPDMPMPSPTATNGYQDLDVLPLLSNEPGYNFWQFSDFAPPPQYPTENGAFSATADLQEFVPQMSFRPPSGMAHSLSNFGTPELADVYSNADGTLFTNTTPSSLESGPTKLSGGSEAATATSNTDAYEAAKFY